MKKATLVHPLMSEAFLIWLEKLGYKGVARAGVITLVVFLAIAVVAFYYVDKWRMAGCL